VLAILCWGASRIPRDTSSLTHVRFWIDNTSAVSWCNGLHSRNPYTQELNRVIGAVEAWWRLRVSAAHLPGSANVLADLGSRAWDGERLARWRELTSSWTQVHVPQNLRKIYSSDLFERMLALQHRSLANSSRRQYGITWRQWNQFCSDLGFSVWLPADRPNIQSLRNGALRRLLLDRSATQRTIVSQLHSIQAQPY
jgi:hypothetical protein